MRRAWKNLNAADARAFERSNAIPAIRVPRNPSLMLGACNLASALEVGARGSVQESSQRLIDVFCELLRVPPLRVEVCGTRPVNRYGELHGLYTPASVRTPDRVQVWMYTARRRQVVAFKTFLRTLLHELCHHLDYEHLKLGRSFHTEGFYKRESSLVYAALPRAPEPAAYPFLRERR